MSDTKVRMVVRMDETDVRTVPRGKWLMCANCNELVIYAQGPWGGGWLHLDAHTCDEPEPSKRTRTKSY